MAQEEYFTAPLKKFSSPLWSYHISVPSQIARKFIEGDNRRVICTLNQQCKFQCALMPDGNDTWFININKKIRDSLKADINTLLEILLEKDTSQYGLPMTDELEELLHQDEEGNKLFHALTPGKQRNLIYIAGQVKNPEKRMSRALVLIEHLKNNNGKIDFKKLNQELKAANSRL